MGTRNQVLLPANFHFVLQNLQRITFIKLVANIYLALNQLQEFIATSFSLPRSGFRHKVLRPRTKTYTIYSCRQDSDFYLERFFIYSFQAYHNGATNEHVLF